ncbi:MAG: hypothetical protein QG635_1799 [Bacteroidota bacterium]|nr:hypothetical protein [Bacteroidota bacterium]
MNDQMDGKKIEIVMVTHNCCQLTLQCIKSVMDTTEGMNIGITLVDNDSTDDTYERVMREYSFVNYIKNNSNPGYGVAINQGVAASSSDYIIVSNSDIIYKEGAIRKLIEYSEKNSEVGAVGPQQVYPDGKWQYSSGDVPGIMLGFKELFFISSIRRNISKYKWNNLYHDKIPREVDYIDGAVMAIKRKLYEKLSGFDERFYHYSDESDLCYRIKKAGYAVILLPAAVVVHYRGASTTRGTVNEKYQKMLVDSRVQFCKKHYTIITAKAYILLEIIHSVLKSSAWKFGGTFLSGSKKENADYYKKWFEYLNKYWRFYLKNFDNAEEYYYKFPI